MFDLIAGAILALFIFNGLRNGFFKESIGLFSLVGGIIAGVIGAKAFAKSIEGMLPGLLGKEPLTYLVCFIGFFILFYFGTKLLAFLFDKLAETLFLGWLNKGLGAVLGGLKGAVIIGLVLHFIAFLPFAKSFGKSQKDTILYQPLYNLVPALYKVLGNPDELPKEMKEIIEEGTETVKDASEKLEDLEKAKELMDGISK